MNSYGNANNFICNNEYHRLLTRNLVLHQVGQEMAEKPLIKIVRKRIHGVEQVGKG